ncbi:MAG TPA: hypothetical protein VFX21_07460, partial [Acidimicrobiia bacterium]|nr:hypothetical protein [Acidimicrobiia bacterium]
MCTVIEHLFTIVGPPRRMYFAAVAFETMPAAVYTGKGAVELQDVPVPQPGDGDVLIEVSHCGICGT